MQSYGMISVVICLMKKSQKKNAVGFLYGIFFWGIIIYTARMSNNYFALVLCILNIIIAAAAHGQKVPHLSSILGSDFEVQR